MLLFIRDTQHKALIGDAYVWFSSKGRTEFRQTLEQNTLRAIADSMATIEFEPTGTIINANPLFLSATGYQVR